MMDLESIVKYDQDARKAQSFSSKYLDWKKIKYNVAASLYETILPMSIGIVGAAYMIVAARAHL
ncbi:hypothetical protein KW805_05025 [Candidatus Pacearchaeota archaeon]|nr:hypothetical protein [Candidatus Pacearchaeota archaeon]